ncbi:hypothetical protein PINS_up024494 [Pythium insidiosum]|nr:hypothetical protein PINS_up024494 [Pythium insidiosum]
MRSHDSTDRQSNAQTSATSFIMGDSSSCAHGVRIEESSHSVSSVHTSTAFTKASMVRRDVASPGVKSDLLSDSRVSQLKTSDLTRLQSSISIESDSTGSSNERARLREPATNSVSVL